MQSDVDDCHHFRKRDRRFCNVSGQDDMSRVWIGLGKHEFLLFSRDHGVKGENADSQFFLQYSRLLPESRDLGDSGQEDQDRGGRFRNGLDHVNENCVEFVDVPGVCPTLASTSFSLALPILASFGREHILDSLLNDVSCLCPQPPAECGSEIFEKVLSHWEAASTDMDRAWWQTTWQGEVVDEKVSLQCSRHHHHPGLGKFVGDDQLDKETQEVALGTPLVNLV
mmetsp:Transcript_31227/g.67215  ORF Transcript_31227/g.67215 Transcript_31227/m.67215 type:complete len:225 (+) Transcript_31227:794-1468(+)